MRIISRARLVSFWVQNRQAETPLKHWFLVTKAARWAQLADVGRTFGHADPVRVKSGNTVVVFNIGGNSYRLIAAVHYNTQWVYVLRVMTHREYSRETWKEDL